MTKERAFIEIISAGEDRFAIIVASHLCCDVMDGKGHGVDRGEGAEREEVVVVGVVCLFYYREVHSVEKKQSKKFRI